MPAATFIQDRAREARSWYECREGVTDAEFDAAIDHSIDLAMTRAAVGRWRVKPGEGKPKWLMELTMAVFENGEILPDDYRMRFMDALEALSRHEDVEEACDALHEECYLSVLTGWLAAAEWRYKFVNCVLAGFPHLRDIGQILNRAYRYEQEEVFGIVMLFLDSLTPPLRDSAETTSAKH